MDYLSLQECRTCPSLCPTLSFSLSAARVYCSCGWFCIPTSTTLVLCKSSGAKIPSWPSSPSWGLCPPSVSSKAIPGSPFPPGSSVQNFMSSLVIFPSLSVALPSTPFVWTKPVTHSCSLLCLCLLCCPELCVPATVRNQSLGLPSPRTSTPWKPWVGATLPDPVLLSR